MTEKDVTFIIPIFNLDGDRLENLKFVLSFILKTNKKVVLAEQTIYPKSSITNHLIDIVANEYKNNFRHELYFHSNPLIHKSGIINWATKHFVDTKYVWVNDVDFYMKFDLALNADWTEDFIKPYSVAKKLSKKDTEKIKTKIPISINFSDPSTNYVSLYSALSFIFNREQFLAIGGMNEKYFGWGKEDVEFNNRVSTLGIAVQELNPKGIHLWHPSNNNDSVLLKTSTEEQNLKTLEPVNVIKPINFFTDLQLNKYFDKIYCINLSRRFEKWETVAREFKKNNLNVTRFEAVDGNSLPINDTLLPGELGCVCSHLHIIEEAKRNGYQNILIFEDDVFLENNFLQKAGIIKNLNWKLFYFGASQIDWTNIEYTNNSYFCKNTLGSFAYAINCSLFDEYIAELKTFNTTVDKCLANLQKKHYGECYTVYPNLVICDVRKSDIRPQQNIFNYANQVKWNITEFLPFKETAKKILLIPDTRNWAFDNIAKAIIKYNPFPDKIHYDITYVKDLQLKKTTVKPTDWDLIYIMFEGEQILPPAKNIVRGCYSAFWLEHSKFTPEYMASYFSQCAGAVFVNNKLKKDFLPYLPKNFPVEVVQDSSDENLFFPIKYRKNKNFTVIFVGNTSRKVKNFDKIKKICQEAKVDLHVCNHVSNNELVFEYNKADILINFSNFEGGPQTFVEAALCEIPTLIKDNNELAKDIPCFTGKNEEDFISILSYLKENRDLCVKKGKEAYNTVIENFTYKHAANKFAKFFIQLK